MLAGTTVLKEDHIQVITDDIGDIPGVDRTNYGLYFYDTRYLNAYELHINGHKPIYLSHSTDRNYLATFQFVNPQMVLAGGTVPRQTISMRRARYVDARGFYERLGFYNCNHFAVDLDVTLTVDADFRDMLAVRGFAHQRIAGHHSRDFGKRDVRFTYVGRDRVTRHTDIRFSREPEPQSPSTMLFRLHLDPHEPVSLTVAVRPYNGRRQRAADHDFDEGLDTLAASYDVWNQDCTALETDNEFFDRSLLRQSRLDVRTLLEWAETPDGGEPDAETLDRGLVPSAGIPWYAVPFGRDAIITALQTLVYNPAIAEGTLRFLSLYQGQKVNPATEEEPGKILHELRRGELANLREIPHLPYYGTVDATPLFVVLFVETMEWLGSDRLYADLLPHALRALEWVDRYGDLDGDGYVEYMPRSQGGVHNQGWKDSVDSLQYQDGSAAQLPAALVEVQGYIYQAKRGLGLLLRRRGDTALADRLEREAQDLRERFNRDFWMPRERFFAQALDAHKQQICSVTSNPGHCLWSEILDPDRARAVAGRLMAPDMFSGWGIRTLSAASPNYNPMSYHNGSVWPHDNAIIALGLRRYGFDGESEAVIEAMIEAGLRFPGNRLPELFCGFTRDRRFNSSPMAYIKSCSPQAWAAAAPFMFLQTLLGLRAEDNGNVIWAEPICNSLFHHYRVSRLRTRSGRTTLRVNVRDEKPTVTLEHGTAVVRSRTAVVDQAE